MRDIVYIYNCQNFELTIDNSQFTITITIYNFRMSPHPDKAGLVAEEVLYDEKVMNHFRKVAFVAVALSTMTMLACIVVLPLSYQYIQRVQSSVSNDIEFCRVRNLNIKIFFKLHNFLNSNFFRAETATFGLKLSPSN